MKHKTGNPLSGNRDVRKPYRAKQFTSGGQDVRKANQQQKKPMNTEPLLCWLCNVNPQQSDSPYCASCQAEIEADDMGMTALATRLRALIKSQGGDPDIIIYHDADGERLDPGEAHEAKAYYVTVQHEGEVSDE